MSNPTVNERFVGLINASYSGTPWTPNQLILGTPSPNDVGVGNTRIDIMPAEGEPFIGILTLRYDRVDLSAIPGTENVDFELAQQSVTWDLIPSVVSRYGYPISEDDIVLLDLPEPDGNGVVHAILEATEDSILWKGNLSITLSPP